MAKNYYIAVVIIIIVVVIGGIFLFNNDAVTETAPGEAGPVVNMFPAHGDDAGEISVVNDNVNPVMTGSPIFEITYTKDGFSPDQATIVAGTEVLFSNQSGGTMWVASDPHPVHTNYSEFDQLENGGAYSFTFTKSGIYNFHDHLNPKNRGKIIVEER